MPTVTLPGPDGVLAPFTMSSPQGFADRPATPFNRVAYAAAHVVAGPLADVDPWLQAAMRGSRKN